MKKTTLYIIVLVMVLGGMSCKKEKETNPVNPTPDCSSATFQIELSESLPIDITEDNFSNTLLLGYSDGNIAVIKLDQNGTVKWKKSYPEIQGTAQNIITLSDNSIIISSGYSTQLNYEPIHIYAMYQQGYDNPNTCQNTYQYKGGFEKYTFTGKSVLTKLNPDGQLIWTKEYDGGFCEGKTLAKTENDHMMFMGYLNFGSQPELVYDSLGIFQDTVNFSWDSNKLYLYEIDGNGNISWQKSLNDIYDNIFVYSGFRNVIYTTSYIVVSMQRDLLIFDHQGNEIKRFIPVSPLCNNRLIAISKADNNNIFVSGEYSTYNDTLQTTNQHVYFSKINLDGNIIWTKEMQGNLTSMLNNAVVIHSEDIGSIYNTEGNLLLNSDYLKTSHISKTCNGGYISVLLKYPDKIIVKKDNLPSKR